MSESVFGLVNGLSRESNIDRILYIEDNKSVSKYPHRKKGLFIIYMVNNIHVYRTVANEGVIFFQIR